MICLTSTEQATAIRCARYSFASLEKRALAGEETQEAMAQIVALIAALEANGTDKWRCKHETMPPWKEST